MTDFRHAAALIAALALLPFGAVAGANPAVPGKLNISLTGLHSAKGQVIACLWQDKVKFPSCEKSTTALRHTLPVTGQSMQLTLPLPAAGDYAVTIIHDEDGNGKMKKNFIGMPAEGVGISNNPGGMPGYAKSLVNVKPGDTITIRMKYLFG